MKIAYVVLGFLEWPWLYPLVNRIRTPDGKGDLWLRVSVSEDEGHKKIGERRTAENTIILVCGSVHNAMGIPAEFAPVGPMRCSPDKPAKKGAREHQEPLTSEGDVMLVEASL